jgi:protocatechuate 3,4-dioxygenase beta subunit
VLVTRFVLAGMVAIATWPTHAAWQEPPRLVGLTGYVLDADGLPVNGGTVVVSAGATRHTAAIDRTGRFHVSPPSIGAHDVSINATGMAPHRLIVDVPPSRTLSLPVIRLTPATFFRARFVTARGEPIIAPRLRHHSVDLSGVPVAVPPDAWSARADGDGVITIGPLPPGLNMLVLDNPPLALTRLPDVHVTGAEKLIEGGTVVIQPGAVLLVDVTESSGAPVAGHDVFLEDVAPQGLSPLPVRRAVTDAQGGATFDRLATGRYRLRTMTARRCGFAPLPIARFVSVSGSGALKTQMVIGGTAIVRVRSPLGALPGVRLSLSPDVAAAAPPPWLRASPDLSPAFRIPSPMMATPCTGTTDAEGLVRLESFPPGPARLDVSLANSRYSRVVNVPDPPREIGVALPDGLVSVRVTSAVKNTPLSGATIVWMGAGSRVEAQTTAAGDALLEAIAMAAGTLTVQAQGHEQVEMKLDEPLAQLHEVALRPTAPTWLAVRVVTASGAPVPDAVVELASESAIEPRQVAATVKSSVRFPHVPSGEFVVTAGAERFVTAAQRVPRERGEELVIRLERGYRVIAEVEAHGPHVLHVMNERGENLDGILDLNSDRVVQAPGQVSLGPLPPGNYSVEFDGAGQRRTHPVRITDSDIHVMVR